MRRGNNPEILMIEDKFVGFNLSADYCAEHEWGIKKIDEVWNRNPETHKLMVNDKALKKLFFSISKCGEYALLYFADWCYTKPPETGCDKTDLFKFNRELYLSSPLPIRKAKKKKDVTEVSVPQIASAWDEDEFALLVCGKDLVEKLQQVHEALKKGDAAIWLGGGGVFQRAGFCIAIYSLLPESVIVLWKEYYEDQNKLKKASEKTGIAERIQKAKLGFYSLSPKWVTEDKKTSTKYSVIYWLNPREQSKNNSGWFTVEELEQWIAGTGPIPNKKS